jgi:5-methylcytosine-specific restriction endonuclease McrA
MAKEVKKENKRTTYYAKDSREAVLDRVHRQRAIKAGVEWEKVDFKELFRTQVNCAICDAPMNFISDQSDPYYVSVDHIIPFSAGGPHKQDNVQLTHIKCNKGKGSK